MVCKNCGEISPDYDGHQCDGFRRREGDPDDPIWKIANLSDAEIVEEHVTAKRLID